MLNGGLLIWAVSVVAVGSLFPVVWEALGGATATVLPRFFVSLLAPVAVIGLIAMGLGLSTRWRGGDESLGRPARLASVLFVATLAFGLTIGTRNSTALALIAAAVVVLGLSAVAIAERRGRRVAAPLAHAGLALVLLGAAGSSLGADFDGPLNVGDVVTVGSYEVRLDGIVPGETDRYSFVRADVTILRNGEEVAVLGPQLRGYAGRLVPTPEPALRSSPVDDIIVGLARVDRGATVAQLTVLVRPLVFWVWWGAVLMAIGGLVALAGRGAPAARQHRLAREEPQPAGTTSDRKIP